MQFCPSENFQVFNCCDLKNLAALLVIFKQRLGELHQLTDLQTERCHENTQVTDHDIVVGEHELLVHLLDVVLHDVEHAHLGEVQRLGKLVLRLIIVSIAKSEANSGAIIIIISHIRLGMFEITSSPPSPA